MTTLDTADGRDERRGVGRERGGADAPAGGPPSKNPGGAGGGVGRGAGWGKGGSSGGAGYLKKKKKKKTTIVGNRQRSDDEQRKLASLHQKDDEVDPVFLTLITSHRNILSQRDCTEHNHRVAAR